MDEKLLMDGEGCTEEEGRIEDENVEAQLSTLLPFILATAMSSSFPLFTEPAGSQS